MAVAYEVVTLSVLEEAIVIIVIVGEQTVFIIAITYVHIVF